MKPLLLYVPISIVSIFIANILYGWSLEGKKDVDWIHHHIGIFGVYIFTASILYFFGFLLLVLLSFTSIIYNPNVKKNNQKDLSIYGLITNYRFLIIIISSFCLILTLIQLFSDTGATLEHHGQYNLIILFGILLLYTIITLFWFISLKFFKLKSIIIGLIIFGIIIITIFYIKRTIYIREWPIGIDNKKLIFNSQINGECKINDNFTPWPSFLPKGFTKYLVGSLECDRTPILAHVKDDNLLVVDGCGDHETTVIINPNFFKGIKDAGSFSPREMDSLDSKYSKLEKSFIYKTPIKLEVDQETIQIKCNGMEQILIHQVKRIEPTTSQKTLNIIFLMVDGLSRAHLKRALPKTYSSLQNIQDNGVARVFQFFKYHSLRPYTDPNTVAMYTGYNLVRYDSDIDEELAHKPHAPHSWETNPFYMQSFKSDRYVKAWIYGFCEDWFGNYLNKEGPQDAYDHEVILPFCAPEAYPPAQPFGNFAGPFSFKRRCLGNDMIHRHAFNYINEMWDNYPNIGKIAHATLMDAHEGTMDVIKLADPEFQRFIGDEMTTRLNDTMLVLVADHGSHMGPYYLWAEGGRIEVASPMLYIVLPTWFLELYPEVETNLLENENRLSSPSQLYETLRHLSTYQEFGGVDVSTEKYPQSKIKSNGLLGKIDNDITCHQLGIPFDFCQCH